MSTTTEAQEIVKLDPETEKVANELEKVSQTGMALVAACKNQFKLAFARANAIVELRKVLNAEIMGRYIMPLMGTRLGFLTDNKPYSVEVVRDVCIEAIMRGLQLSGAHFMIFHGQMYAMKNGCRHLVLTYPGITNLVVTPQTPKMVPGGAIVGVRATWNFNGQAMSLDRTGDAAYAIRLQGDMGADAALGKATRRAYASIYEILTNNRETIEDIDEDELKPVEGVTVAEPTTTTNGKDHAPAAATQSQSDRAAAILRAQQEAPKTQATEPPAPTNVQEGKPEGAKKTKSKKTQEAAPAQAAPAAAAPAPATQAAATPAAGQAPAPAAQPAAAAPAAAKPAQPKPEEIEEARFVPAKVVSYTVPTTKETVYRIRDEKLTTYTTSDLAKAKEARSAQETKSTIALTYFKRDQDYIIVELKVERPPVSNEPPPEDEGTEEDLK